MTTKTSRGSSKNAELTRCRRHNGEPITVFSTKFEKSMCLKCAMAEHDFLTDFVPLSEGVGLMRAEGNRLLDELSSLSDTTQNIKHNQTNYLHRFHAAEKNIKATLRKTRDRINRQLDTMEQKLLNKLKQIVVKREKVYSKNQHDITVLELELKQMRGNVSNVLKTGNEIALISTIVQEKNAFHQRKHEAKEQEEKITSKVIHLKISPAVIEFIENVQELGEVSSQTSFENNTEEPTQGQQTYRSRDLESVSPLSYASSRPVPRRTHGSNHGHGLRASRLFNRMNGAVTSRRTVHLDELDESTLSGRRTFQDFKDEAEIQSAEHDSPCILSGIAVLSSGRIVVCDSKHKCLQLINRRSEVLDNLVFRYKPCDIAVTSDDSVAVSFLEKDFISLFNVSDYRLVHKRDLPISGRGGSYSIASCKSRVAVCRRGEIRIVSIDDGSMVSIIQIDAHFPQIAMSDGGSKLYLSDYVTGKVTCMNEMGKTKWEYSQEELEPRSLAVDLNQLFIADVKGKILILSTYGILKREIPCPGHLYSLCVDPNTGTILTTQESKDRTRSQTINIIPV